MKALHLRTIIFMALCCDLGLFSKRLIAPIANIVTDSLHIPGGVGTSFSLMFLVVAAALIPIFGVATVIMDRETINTVRLPDPLPADAFDPLPDAERNTEFIAVESRTYFQNAWRNFRRNKLALAFVVLGVAILIFSIMYFVPGNPAQIILGPTATQEQVDALSHDMGLDQPYLVQLGHYLSDTFLHGDLGTSYQSKRAVATELMERFPRTLIIAAWPLAF